MGIRYLCTNTNCNYPGNSQFEMLFKEETIMDSNNIATTFCPFCKQELTASIFTTMTCNPKISIGSNSPRAAS